MLMLGQFQKPDCPTAEVRIQHLDAVLMAQDAEVVISKLVQRPCVQSLRFNVSLMVPGLQHPSGQPLFSLVSLGLNDALA